MGKGYISSFKFLLGCHSEKLLKMARSGSKQNQAVQRKMNLGWECICGIFQYLCIAHHHVRSTLLHNIDQSPKICLAGLCKWLYQDVQGMH